MWQANVSSAYNEVYSIIAGRPFMTWSSFTVAQYLAATLGLMSVLVMLFAVMAGIIGLCSRNTYVSFIVYGAVMLGTIFAASVFGNIGFFEGYYIMQFAPAWLCYTQSLWFTDMGEFSVIAHHESVAMIVNVVILTGLTWLAMWRFNRRDI
jgi:hypothetical protein